MRNSALLKQDMFAWIILNNACYYNKRISHIVFYTYKYSNCYETEVP